MKTVVDLFAGCGGMSLGLEMAGFTPVFVSELHPDALRTYTQNRSGLVTETTNQASDILALTQDPAELDALASRLHREHGDIDLVVGGPPCQGFSGIGHRRTFTELEKFDIPSNHLYKEMAKVIAAVSPRAFIFENVRGLLSARWFSTGTRGEIWDAVQEAFKAIETTNGRSYKLAWKLLRAADHGVPQNRPRVILIGIRDDVDVVEDKEKWHPQRTVEAPDAVDILGDLVDEGYRPGGVTRTYPSDPTTPTQEWMRTRPSHRSPELKGAPLAEQEYSRHSQVVQARFRALLNDGIIPDDLLTKKFNQRPIPPVWPVTGPSITVASMPDDYVHFSQPRACTVREWARLQTFPDWYQFAGHRTTGGRRRAGDPSLGIWSRDLPKFTQIGNAVPVRMAEEIGLHLIKLGIFDQ